jgi:hypothetical protein
MTDHLTSSMHNLIRTSVLKLVENLKIFEIKGMIDKTREPLKKVICETREELNHLINLNNDMWDSTGNSEVSIKNVNTFLFEVLSNYYVEQPRFSIEQILDPYFFPGVKIRIMEFLKEITYKNFVSLCFLEETTVEQVNEKDSQYNMFLKRVTADAGLTIEFFVSIFHHLNNDLITLSFRPHTANKHKLIENIRQGKSILKSFIAVNHTFRGMADHLIENTTYKVGNKDYKSSCLDVLLEEFLEDVK